MAPTNALPHCYWRERRQGLMVCSCWTGEQKLTLFARFLERRSSLGSRRKRAHCQAHRQGCTDIFEDSGTGTWIGTGVRRRGKWGIGGARGWRDFRVWGRLSHGRRHLDSFKVSPSWCWAVWVCGQEDPKMRPNSPPIDRDSHLLSWQLLAADGQSQLTRHTKRNETPHLAWPAPPGLNRIIAPCWLLVFIMPALLAAPVPANINCCHYSVRSGRYGVLGEIDIEMALLVTIMLATARSGPLAT